MRNQTSFRLTTTLLPTDKGADHKARVTQVINKVDADGNKFYPSFTNETVVLTNDDRTIMETTIATADGNGNITFVKRGLSDDQAATEIANRALTWNPGSIAFITVGAADLVDIDDDLTWTGNQTYTGSATYQGQLITQKGVQYPSFADVTELEAYSSPFGGMFATVEDTGELYRYNAVTEQWDLVSTVELGNYIIRADDDAPAPGTSDTIVTLRPTTGNIYLGESLLVGSTKCVQPLDLILVGGGGAGGNAAGTSDGACYFAGSGGGGGEVIAGTYLGSSKTYDVVIGCGGKHLASQVCKQQYLPGGDGGDTKFGFLTAHGGKGGKLDNCALCDVNRSVGGNSGGGYVGAEACCAWRAGGGGGGAGGNGCNCGYHNYCWNGGDGGPGKCGFGGGGGGGGSCQYGQASSVGGKGCDGGGDGGKCCTGCNATNYGGGGGGGGNYQHCCIRGSGGDGCQGIVIVKYPTDGSYGINCATGGTVTTCDGYTIHTFTENGTFCIIN